MKSLIAAGVLIATLAMAGLASGAPPRTTVALNAARGELNHRPAPEREAFALDKCAAAEASGDHFSIWAWCDLAWDHRDRSLAPDPRVGEAGLSALWAAALEGGDAPQARDLEPYFSVAPDPRKAAVETWALRAIGNARAGSGLRFRANEHYDRMAQALDGRPLAATDSVGKREELMARAARTPHDPAALWAAAAVALTPYYAMSSEHLGAEEARAQASVLVPLLRPLLAEAAKLGGRDGALEPLLATALADLMEWTRERRAADALRLDAADRCIAKLSRASDVCMQLRYQVALSRVSAQGLAALAAMNFSTAHAPPPVGPPPIFEADIEHEYCRAILIIDITDDGKVTNPRVAYSDPPGACDATIIRYASRRRFAPISADRPGERRRDLIEPSKMPPDFQ